MIGGAERGYPQLAQAQGDVREVYRGGFVGQLVSGAVRLLAAAAGTWLSAGAAVIVLRVGGVLIFPLTSWCLRLSGRPAALPGGHPMAALATQIAFTVPPGMLVAVALAQYRPEWFLQLRPPGQPGAPPAGPSKPDVDQPRPDLRWSSGDRDGPGGIERRARHELVTWQGTCHLARRRPPGGLPGPHIPGVDRHRGGGGQDGRTGTRPHDPRLGEGSTDPGRRWMLGVRSNRLGLPSMLGAEPGDWLSSPRVRCRRSTAVTSGSAQSAARSWVSSGGRRRGRIPLRRTGTPASCNARNTSWMVLSRWAAISATVHCRWW